MGLAVPGLFVAGAGTEIGKTYVTAGLVRALRARERLVRPLKPVASGVP
ncbi:AAA family ATPase, partial [Klebsiella aerogenes]